MSTMKKFCPKCNNENQLYPKEDEAWKIRVYACRTCDHQEVAQHYVVAANRKDLRLIYSRLAICPKCDRLGAEFFPLTTSKGRVVGLSFICNKSDCGHRYWDDDEKAEK
ncbi:DNA-directed RNA polymerases II, IV and V subunit 9A-like [Ipomoea triloba]|uniref:DNA-directed RNA polymerases II, IV and V subunit 9A-like n=1 Tax=Ipomoea triloba TaxID=35885 RepID=UPI00125D21E8|nr:DNA-directed RNA polymerases II, IV and V subunit 9A-like [Ipomoea triloba]